MINFKALRKAMERMDGSKDGKFGRCGNWKIALGGYDMGYEVYYKDEPVMRVNYELDEYEFYSCDYSDVMFTPDTVPQIKKVLDITPEFDNVGDIDDNGDYNVSESGISKQVTNEEDSMNLKFEIEIDGVNAPIEDVENAIKDILYNQLDMELGADYNKFKVSVNHLNDKHNEKIVKESYANEGVDYSKFNPKDGEVCIKGRGLRCWTTGDVDKPTGPIMYPVFFFPKGEEDKFMPLIDKVNKKVPRVGRRIDPWWYAKRDFIKAGGRINEYIGYEL